MARGVLDHGAWQDMGSAHPLDAFLHVVVVLRHEPLPGLDEKVDNLGKRHVQQRRHFRARRDRPVERDARRGEGDAKITRGLDHVGAVQHFAAQEKRGRDEGFVGAGFAQVVHATPRT